MATSNFSTPEELTFVDQVDEKFACISCKNVLRPPVLQAICGHRICQICAHLLLEHEEEVRCPGKEDDCEMMSNNELNPDRATDKELLRLKVYCPNTAQGCDHKTEWRFLRSHTDSCPFHRIKCPNEGCAMEFIRSRLGAHQLECQFSPVLCDYCDNDISREEMDRGHSLMCILKERKCKYHKFGCEFKASYQHMQDHLTNATGRHLAMAIREIERHQLSHAEDMSELRNTLADLVRSTMELDTRITNDLVNRVLSVVGDNLVAIKISSSGHLDETVKQLTKRVQAMISHETRIASIENQISIVVQPLVDQISQMKKTIDDMQMSIRKLEGKKNETEGTSLQSAITKLNDKLFLTKDKSGASNRVNTRESVENRKHITVSLRPNPTSSSFRIESRISHLEQIESMGCRGYGGRSRDNVEKVGSLETFAGLYYDLQIRILPTTSLNGQLFWRITQYSRRKKDAIEGRTLSLYSQPFYSSFFGYKMCARVYLNGDGLGKGSHLSFFFVIMRGKYDSLLQWPFRQRVTLTLLDQSGNRKHITDTFRPDPTSSSFRRPVGEMNIASGSPLFAPHAKVEAEPFLKDQSGNKKHISDTFRPDVTSSSFRQPIDEMNIASGSPLFVTQEKVEAGSFLKDDTIFLSITVDKTDMPEPQI